MFQELPQVFCKEHRELITHLDVSIEQKNKLTMCGVCAKSSNSISLFQAFERGEAFKEKYLQIITIKQNSLSQIHKLTQVIKENILIQQQLVENIEREIDSIIQIENFELDEFLQNKKYGDYNLLELERYAIFLAGAQNIHQKQEAISQEKLNLTFENFLKEFLSTNNQMFNIIQRLGKKLASLIDNFKMEILQLSQKKILVSESIEHFDYFLFSKVLVVASGDLLTTYHTRDMQFEKAFKINTYHKKITSLYLDQRDKSNSAIYTSGADSLIKIWINQHSCNYVLKRFFQIHSDDIFKMIYIPSKYQIITGTKKMLMCWNSESGEELQKIGQNIHQTDIVFFDINNSGACIICQTNNFLTIWKNDFFWSLVQKTECIDLMGLCFVNNSQFFSFLNNNQLVFWQLESDRFFEKHRFALDFKAENPKLLYIQEQSILLCISNQECQFFQFKDNLKLILLETIQGKNFKICVSKTGEYIIIYNLGLLSIRKTSKFLEGT